MSDFILSDKLRHDTVSVAETKLNHILLMDDGRWPWLVLVPKRKDVFELFELPPADVTVLGAEIALLGAILKEVTGAQKINIGSLGHAVRQLHVHIVARYEGDRNWPRPVWGFATREPWDRTERANLVMRIQRRLKSTIDFTSQS